MKTLKGGTALKLIRASEGNVNKILISKVISTSLVEFLEYFECSQGILWRKFDCF